MRGEMELWNHPSNDAVIQMFGVVEGEPSQPCTEVLGPLAHDIVRRDLFWLGVVLRASDDNIVNIRISKKG